MKKIFYGLILLFGLFLVSCKDSKESYKDKGYTSTVQFDFNGGILTNAVTDITNSIKYAFEPNSYICDPTELPNCVLKKQGFDFLGWYKDADLTEPWDFKKDKITEDIVLYAKWGTKIVYSYTLAYVDEAGTEQSLYTYTVEAKDTFSDFLSKANTREGYTAYGFFKDKNLTSPWDVAFQHPGGEESLDVKVYVRYIKGTYTLVSTLEELNSATGSIYLLNDINCNGQALKFAREFSGTLEGNGHTISNFTIEAQNRAILRYSIFSSLLDGASIQNVTFDGATILLPTKTVRELSIAGLAGEASGNVTISNVEVKNSKVIIPEGLSLSSGGTLTIKIDQPVYIFDEEKLIVKNFKSNYEVIDQRG